MNELITTAPQVEVSIFGNINSFTSAVRMAEALSSSSLVPKEYRGEPGVANCLVALDIAKRINATPLMVMQNLHVIEGRPSWSAQFLIAAINTCGKFSPLRFVLEDLGTRKVQYEYWAGPRDNRERREATMDVTDRSCVAWATEYASGERLESPTVSIGMAVAEGWFTRAGSKWKTMPDLMLRYRAAAFFSRLYAPEVSLGLPTMEESGEIIEHAPVRATISPPEGAHVPAPDPVPDAPVDAPAEPIRPATEPEQRAPDPKPDGPRRVAKPRAFDPQSPF
jgi:hypothetical protein